MKRLQRDEWFLLCALLLACAASQLHAQNCDCPRDSTPQLVEPNWGQLYDGPSPLPSDGTSPTPAWPRYVMYSFAVSPDGRWLAYCGGWQKLGASLQLKDLQTGTVRLISTSGYEPQWHPNSSLLMYTDSKQIGRVFYDVSSDRGLGFVGYCDTTMPICSLRELLGPDGNLYFVNCYTESHGSVSGLYRIPLDSSLRAGCAVYERVSPDGEFIWTFPPTTLKWYLSSFKYWEVPGLTSKNVGLYRGFSIVRDFDWQKQRTIRVFDPSAFPAIDTTIMKFGGDSWIDYRLDNDLPGIGACGELYMHFNFIHKQEAYAVGGYLQHDTTKLWVRALGGWYRLDTNAHTFTQLARSWSPLGISVTADGGKLYYGLHTPDSMMSIWEMDRCGRNKRQVTFPQEDPFTYLLSVKENGTPQAAQQAQVLPNPVTGERALLSFVATEPGGYRMIINDALGQQVRASQILVEQAGMHEQWVDVRGLPGGVYFTRIVQAGSTAIVQARFVVAR